jgi:hypothetical protein
LVYWCEATSGQAVSRSLIILTGAIYAYIAIESVVKGNNPLAVVYAGYAFSNVGLWLLAE